jgi:hypothetical protein
MGETVSLECGHCLRTQELHIGSGMMYGSFTLDDIVKQSRGKVKKEVAALLETELVKSNNCHEELLACPKCNTLSTRFSFELFDKQGECVYVSKFKCSRCKTALVPADKKKTDYCCRYCFSPSLRYGELVELWD